MGALASGAIISDSQHAPLREPRRANMRRTILAKGQMKSNKEKKKPKQDPKLKAAAKAEKGKK